VRIGCELDYPHRRVELNEEKAERLAGQRMEALFWVLTPTLVCTRVSGHVELDALHFYTQRIDRLLMKGQTLQVFHDWTGITGFDPEVRSPYRDWAATKEKLVFPVFLVKSKVLAMALSVSALVIGRDLTILSDRQKFSQGLAQAMADSRESSR
jgi:hypothetical protein